LRVSYDSLTHTDKPVIHPKFKDYAAARYLGYGLMVAFGRNDGATHSGQLERDCLNESQTFSVTLLFRQAVDPSVRSALIAWGLLGGLGSRSRHGMGSVALISLKSNSSSSDQWIAPTDKKSYDARIKELLVASTTTEPLPAPLPPFSAFCEYSRIDRLLAANDCYAVLDAFGKAMLMYRSWGKTDRGNKLPGGDVSEKRFADDHDWYRTRGWATTHPNFHPERVVFGLPHNYHQNSHHVTAEKHERRSSPLLFHVHPVGNEFIGISIYLPAQFLPNDEKIKANGVDVPARIDWSIIPRFLDGKVGNPPAPGAPDRFPKKDKMAVLP
jgi:CRISPR-associated protein Cmr1